MKTDFIGTEEPKIRPKYDNNGTYSDLLAQFDGWDRMIHKRGRQAAAAVAAPPPAAAAADDDDDDDDDILRDPFAIGDDDDDDKRDDYISHADAIAIAKARKRSSSSSGSCYNLRKRKPVHYSK